MKRIMKKTAAAVLSLAMLASSAAALSTGYTYSFEYYMANR